MQGKGFAGYVPTQSVSTRAKAVHGARLNRQYSLIVQGVWWVPWQQAVAGVCGGNSRCHVKEEVRVLSPRNVWWVTGE